MANLDDLFAQLKASSEICGANAAPSEANTSINLKESSRIVAEALASPVVVLVAFVGT
jgi:hypothetical protein